MPDSPPRCRRPERARLSYQRRYLFTETSAQEYRAARQATYAWRPHHAISPPFQPAVNPCNTLRVTSLNNRSGMKLTLAARNSSRAWCLHARHACSFFASGPSMTERNVSTVLM